MGLSSILGIFGVSSPTNPKIWRFLGFHKHKTVNFGVGDGDNLNFGDFQGLPQKDQPMKGNKRTPSNFSFGKINENNNVLLSVGKFFFRDMYNAAIYTVIYFQNFGLVTVFEVILLIYDFQAYHWSS